MKKLVIGTAVLVLLIALLYVAIGIHDLYLLQAASEQLVARWDDGGGSPDPIVDLTTSLSLLIVGVVLIGVTRLENSWLFKIPLTVDLEFHAISGISLRKPATELRAIGFGDHQSQDGTLLYGVGVELSLEKGNLVGIATYFSRTPTWRRQVFSPFSGAFRFRRQKVNIRSATTEEQLLRAFGAPKLRVEQADSPYLRLFYETGKVATLFVLAKGDDGARLLAIHMVVEQSQAYAVLRALYGPDAISSPGTVAAVPNAENISIVV